MNPGIFLWHVLYEGEWNITVRKILNIWIYKWSITSSVLVKSLCLLLCVCAAPAFQASQWDSRCGSWIRDYRASGKVAQLHLTHLHPGPHPHLPGRVGGPLAAHHHYSSCPGGLLHLLLKHPAVCLQYIESLNVHLRWPQCQTNLLFIFLSHTTNSKCPSLLC